MNADNAQLAARLAAAEVRNAQLATAAAILECHRDALKKENASLVEQLRLSQEAHAGCARDLRAQLDANARLVEESRAAGTVFRGLVRALRFYARPDQWSHDESGQVVWCDAGEGPTRARKALALFDQPPEPTK